MNRKEYEKEYRIKNKERISQYYKEYYKQHKEKLIQQHKEWNRIHSREVQIRLAKQRIEFWKNRLKELKEKK